MGTGYVRNDTANNIAAGKTARASDLDGEFDALVAAMATTGHTHDGTTGEGGPVEVIGPAQDFVAGAASLSPKTTNAYSLGTTSLRWSTGWFQGAVTAAGGFAGNLTGNVTGNLTGDVTGDVTGSVTGSVNGNSTTATALQTARTISLGGDLTGSQSFDGSANITITAAVVDDSHSHSLSTITGLGTIATQNAASVAITGGSITGITDLAVADGGTGASTAVNARSNLGLVIGTHVQAYSAFLNTLSTQGNVRNADIANGAITIGKIDAPSTLTGADTRLVTGTAGAAGNIPQWNADGDIVSGYTVGTSANNLVQLNGSGELPAVSAINLTNVQGLGVGQTWQDVTSSRSGGSTSYQNTTGKPIMINVRGNNSNLGSVQVSTDNTTWVTVSYAIDTSEGRSTHGIIIPNGHYYRVTGTGPVLWTELR